MAIFWTPQMKARVIEDRLAGETMAAVADNVGVTLDTLRKYCKQNNICTESARKEEWKQWKENYGRAETHAAD